MNELSGLSSPSFSMSGAATAIRRDGRNLEPHERRAVHDAFRQNRFLHAWPVHVIDALCDAADLRSYFNGELVVARDTRCDDIHVVLSGSIEVSWTNAAGMRAVTHYNSPNEIINFIPVIDGRGSMHDQRVHGHATLLHIPGAALFEQFAREPTLLSGVLDLVCARCRAAQGRMRKQELSTFRARLADQILLLAEWHGRPTSRGTELTIRLSQADLAALMVASRQRVNRELGGLVRAGIVEIRYSCLTVLDMEGLRALSMDKDE